MGGFPCRTLLRFSRRYEYLCRALHKLFSRPLFSSIHTPNHFKAAVAVDIRTLQVSNRTIYTKDNSSAFVTRSEDWICPPLMRGGTLIHTTAVYDPILTMRLHDYLSIFLS